MWIAGVLAGFALAATVTYRLLGRDQVAPIERRRRALALLREMSEHPRPPARQLVPPSDYRTDHVRILERVPSEVSSRLRMAPRHGASRRAHREGGLATRPDDRLLSERPTVAICPASSALSTSAANAPDASLFEEQSAARPAPAELGSPNEPHVPEARSPYGRTRRSIESRASSGLRPAFAVVVLTIVAVLVAAHLNRGVQSSGRPRVAPAATATPKPVIVATTSPPVPTTAAPVTAVPVVVHSTSGATVSVRRPSNLTLRAIGTCWIAVDDAIGRTVFSGTLHTGQERQVAVSGPLVLHLGNTPAIVVSVGTAQLDLHGLSQTARLDFQTA